MTSTALAGNRYRSSAVGAARRLALLDSPLPLTVIEATPGAGTGTLLRRWAAVEEPTDCRVLVTRTDR